MGSIRGIRPTGGSSGTRLILSIRDRLTMMYPYINIMNTAGLNRARMSKSSAVAQIVRKMPIDTSCGGNCLSTQSFSTGPEWCSIVWKKPGNVNSRATVAIAPKLNFHLKTDDFQAVCQIRSLVGFGTRMDM